jgi:amino acid transporter
MRHARRAIAILTGFATGFIAAATVAYAAVVPNSPLVGDQWWNAAPATTSTSAAGLPLWQFLAFVALGVLVAVAIVGLGHSLSHSQRSQTPLRS